MKRFVMAFGLASLSLGLALPLVFAQEHGGMEKTPTDKTAQKDSCGDMKGCEEVTIDKPFAEIARRIPDAIEKGGLILAGEVDWLKLSTKGMRTPQGGDLTPRLLAAKGNVKTFLVVDDKLVNSVLEEPKHGFWIGKIVAFDDGGKTKLLYFKPSVMLEKMKEHGAATAEKAEKHMEHAREYEGKLVKVIENLQNIKKD